MTLMQRTTVTEVCRISQHTNTTINLDSRPNETHAFSSRYSRHSLLSKQHTHNTRIHNTQKHTHTHAVSPAMIETKRGYRC